MTALFQVVRLKKSFGGLDVTRDVSLLLQKGDRLALIGPNGAGKTTFVNLVTGTFAAQFRQGADGWRGHFALSIRCGASGAGLVRSFQVTRLFAEMTPEQHVALAILQRRGQIRQGRGFIPGHAGRDAARPMPSWRRSI